MEGLGQSEAQVDCQLPCETFVFFGVALLSSEGRV